MRNSPKSSRHFIQNLKRIKKDIETRKLRLMEKHLKGLEKVQGIKENKEKMNMKARVEASLASQEHAKGKNLKLLILNSTIFKSRAAMQLNRVKVC